MIAQLEEILSKELVEPDSTKGFSGQALCNDSAGTLVGLFFSEQLNDIAVAKSICQKCPVREPCLEGALERREPWGVWGGELFLNGRVLAYKRKRGRPPKIARPEEVAAATGVPLAQVSA